MPALPAVPTIYKQPWEDIAYDFDFTPLLGSGETLSSATSATGDPSGLTIGSPALNGTKKVQVRISGGTNGQTYTVTVRAATSAANNRECEAYFVVADIGAPS